MWSFVSNVKTRMVSEFYNGHYDRAFTQDEIRSWVWQVLEEYAGMEHSSGERYMRVRPWRYVSKGNGCEFVAGWRVKA